jgi:DNA-binding NarL/FixJ family response regulator
MRCFWEQIGVLGPIYRLAGRGLSNDDIAHELGVTEVTVQSCITWILHFLKFTSREELVLCASGAA